MAIFVESSNERGERSVKRKRRQSSNLTRIIAGSLSCAPPGGGGEHSLIWAIRGRAAGQGMVFWCRCPKQGIQFDLPLPYTGSEPVLNRVWYYEPRD